VLDDMGIPRNHMHMNGSGVNTYIFANSKNEGHLVRFLWKTLQGVENLLDGDITDKHLHFSQHTKDLYEAISTGKFPKWELYVQRLPLHPNLEELGFDPLDVTKLWPPHIVPENLVGVMELNEWPGNLFNEMEMIAVTPGRLVPGILPSDDKMLQARLFAYGDAQRYRLGVNHQLLPINRPRCPFLHDDFAGPYVDGLMNTLNVTSEFNYFPSTFNSNIKENPLVAPDAGERVNGAKVRRQIPEVGDDFQQPRERYSLWDVDRRQRFAMRWATMLTANKMDTDDGIKVRNIWLNRLKKVSAELRKDIDKYMNSNDPAYQKFKKEFCVTSPC